MLEPWLTSIQLKLLTLAHCLEFWIPNIHHKSGHLGSLCTRNVVTSIKVPVLLDDLQITGDIGYPCIWTWDPWLSQIFAKVSVSAVQLKLVTPLRTPNGLLSHWEVSLNSDYELQGSGFLWCSISQCSHFRHSSFYFALFFSKRLLLPPRLGWYHTVCPHRVCFGWMWTVPSGLSTLFPACDVV